MLHFHGDHCSTPLQPAWRRPDQETLVATFKEMDNYIVFAVVRLLRVDVIDAMAAEVVGGGTAGAPVIIIYSINIGYIILDEAALNSWAARAAAGYSRPATATSFSLMPITAPRTTRELVMPDNTPRITMICSRLAHVRRAATCQ